MFVRGLVFVLGWTVLALATVQPGVAQERPDTTARPDTTTGPPPADSSRRRPSQDRDTTRQRRNRPSASRSDRASGATSSDQNPNAVSFSAQDSLVVRTDSAGNDNSTLYGESEMSYQETSLKARIITLNFQTGTLQAEGSPSDTAEGGRPIFEQGSGGEGSRSQSGGGFGGGNQSFTGKALSYNLNTKRGRVVTARTQQRDALIQGGAVKMYEDSTLFVQEGSYTTCNCPPGVTPSYSLRSDEMKVQDEWVYTKSIRLFLFNVPTPLWLPFGVLPNSSGRRSGPLAPEYGEDRRGFFLKDMGWYFALNSFTDLTIRGTLWSKGSYEIRPRFRYRKRNAYNGDLRLTYRRVRIGEEEDPNPTRRHEGEIQWTHSQDLSPTARISGDVNLTTSGDFSQRNSDNFEDAVQQDISSSVNYRKTWAGGARQINLNVRQNQQFQSGDVSLTLPNLGFSQNTFKPFKQQQRVGEERWYEKLQTSYELDVNNTYDFRPRDPDRLRQRGDTTLANSIEQADIDWFEALVNRDKFELATGDDQIYDFEATHRVPLNMNFRLDRYNLTITPSFDYTSDWLISTKRLVAQRDSTGGVGEIVEQTQPDFFARQEFNTSLSASSEIFGTFPVALGSFRGLRHRMSPSLSGNFRPNFNAPFWGETRRIRFADGTPVPKDALDQTSRFSIVDGSRVRNSTEQRSVNFSLRNVFETKRVRVDSTGEEQTEKITLLNLDLRGLSYNFAADSFQVGRNIRLNARTRFNTFNISAQSTFSPYALERRQVGEDRFEFRAVDQLMITESPLTPARLTRFRLNVSADFSSDDRGGARSDSRRHRGRSRRPSRSSRIQSGQRSTQNASRGHSSQGPSRPSSLTELDIPWSLSFDFNYSFRKPQKEVTNRDATIGADFSFSVTPRWSVQGNTGYDIIDKEVSTTRLSINRSLGCGCWDMSFSWVPFGRFQQFGFNLQVSSGRLSQLLQLQVPNEGGEGRFGGVGDNLINTAQGAASGRGGRGGRRRR